MIHVHAGDHVYDAATPANVPSGSLGLPYVNTDGTFSWDQYDVDRMLGVLGISESTNIQFARFARIFAVEPGADTPQAAPGFCEERARLGHHDSIGYVNLSNWHDTEQACLDAGHNPDWFVAHPGDRHPERLRSPIRGKRPVMVQIAFGRGFDLSRVMRPLEFTSPHEFHATGR